MPIKLPPVSEYYFENGKNFAVKNYSNSIELNNYIVEEGSELVIISNECRYLFTNNAEIEIQNEFEYVLLTSRKPNLEAIERDGEIIKKWLRHPKFRGYSSDEILASWEGQFRFIGENETEGIQGLRPPQLGALHAVLAHSQYAENRAIIVMPTGTGKTEVMLSALVAMRSPKLLVTVPSDALRSQIALKFLTLGLLRQLNLISEQVLTPIVGVMRNRINNIEELDEFFGVCNVIVTTMPLLVGYSQEQKARISSQISHLFVDEAHHSQASTWSELINGVNYKKVYLFTATPFRSDERRLQGKFIFNFPLRSAQEQQYYKQINYLPVREYNREVADLKIATKAVEQLRLDRTNGFPHILMARCSRKNRAQEIAAIYETFNDFRSVVIFNGVSNLKQKVSDVKNGLYDIVICVDMLGEGFDLPELKIAAIHDERQSIPITLQFVGRFTRTSFNRLGNPSFITNIAYPPIQEELEQLYAHDADWNLLLPRLNAEATQRQIDFGNFLEGFNNLNNSNIPFEQIRPALSTVIYSYTRETWQPNNWRAGFPGIDSYDHQYSDYNPIENTLVIIVGRISKVDWGDFDSVQNMKWDIVNVIWDLRPGTNRIFVNFSIDGFNPKKMIEAIFHESAVLLEGMNVFRIFHDVKRLAVFNFGGRPGSGGDISFRSFFGKGVQDGINLVEQGTLIKNNIFGAGYRDGTKVTLGCSIKGKIWSYERGNLQELKEWCKSIGDIITNDQIDPNTVLQHTLSPTIVHRRPSITPVAVDWNPDMYAKSEEAFRFTIQERNYDVSRAELEIVEVEINSPLRFALKTEDTYTIFQLNLGAQELDGKIIPFYEYLHIEGPLGIVSVGSREGVDLISFFRDFSPVFWFADGSQLINYHLVSLREHPGRIPLENIIPLNWEGVDIRKESQGVEPYIRDSIQYGMIQRISDEFQIIYDDDNSGEIADIIGINDFDNYIEISLFHLKYAKNGRIGNDIDNIYQVCGQAQKSLNWKYKKGSEFFNHLFRRLTKRDSGRESSRLIKGGEADLDRLLSSAKWNKELRFKIYIAQPSFRRENVSDDILLLLGTTYHYLATVGNVELKVYSS